MKKLREEDGLGSDEEEDDESKWEGWDVETDSSESSDDEEWINVDSDDDKAIEVSDSDDEDEKKMDDKPDEAQPQRVSTLVTTKVRHQWTPMI